MIGSFLYPSDLSLASCTTTSCLCKSCQRTLSSCSLHAGEGAVFPKASAKVLLFPEPAKFLHEYFQETMHFYRLDDGNQGKTEMFGEYEQMIEERRGEERRASRTRRGDEQPPL